MEAFLSVRRQLAPNRRSLAVVLQGRGGGDHQHAGCGEHPPREHPPLAKPERIDRIGKDF